MYDDLTDVITSIHWISRNTGSGGTPDQEEHRIGRNTGSVGTQDQQEQRISRNTYIVGVSRNIRSVGSQDQ